MPELPTMFDLTGRVAVVTGSAGLLGSEFCRTLAEAGASVVLADLDSEGNGHLAQAMSKDGYDVHAVTVDVSEPKSVTAMVKEALERFDTLDILVNSAALDPKFDMDHQGEHASTFEDYPVDTWNEALKVNLTGLFLTTQAVVRPMLAQGGGVIVNICSIYGLVSPDQRIYQRPGKPVEFKPVYYTVTKAGVLGLTRYLAGYYAGKNIRVNALTPGGVFNEHDELFVEQYAARTMLGRMADRSELNAALLFLASDASSYMTGANLVVDGGWTAW
ncbi:MAG: SDR family oxidoreductase [Anaerolineales bacterium]|nr:SDR family oxidoreductase [Anaerolineales bacterium]